MFVSFGPFSVEMLVNAEEHSIQQFLRVLLPKTHKFGVEHANCLFEFRGINLMIGRYSVRVRLIDETMKIFSKWAGAALARNAFPIKAAQEQM